MCNFHLDDQTLGGSPSGRGNFKTQAETLACTTARQSTELQGPRSGQKIPEAVSGPLYPRGGVAPAQNPVPFGTPFAQLLHRTLSKRSGTRSLTATAGWRSESPTQRWSRSKAPHSPAGTPSCHKACGAGHPRAPAYSAQSNEPHRCPTAAGQRSPRDSEPLPPGSGAARGTPPTAPARDKPALKEIALKRK